MVYESGLTLQQNVHCPSACKYADCMNAQRALDKLSFVASGFHPFVFDISSMVHHYYPLVN